jgi:hypothetical protein
MSLQNLLEKDVLTRILILWLVSMPVLWLIFAVGAYTHQDAWVNVQAVEPQTGWNVFWFILRNNFLILGLITLGNLFVRFGAVTPGLLILAIQIVTIGWTAGTNSFMEPFPSIEAANTAFVRIGLWEITAYISICAITLSKSILVADTFPAKRWTKTTRLKDVTFTRAEVIASLLSVFALVSAAYIEAFFPLHMS